METRIMLNVVAKVSEVTGELKEGASQGNGRNGDTGKARSHTVSVLGGGMKVTGEVSGEGELRIEGSVEGSVSTGGRVVVEASGEVKGDIEAAEVIASGKISGKITASGAVRLESGCQVEADIEAATISLEEGGIVNGTLKMGSSGRS
jgi:cytoskeletal protein CcmA (bactofilin family)